MTQPEKPPVRPRRRWSIGKTLVWTAVVVLGVGRVAWLEWRLHERLELLADIQERGGFIDWAPASPVWLDHFQPDPPSGPDPFANVWGPNWLRSRLPLAAIRRRWGCLGEITRIRLRANAPLEPGRIGRTTPFGDDEAVRLRTCPGLEVLILVETKIGNPALQTIGNLRGLKELQLRGSPISSGGLQELSDLAVLESLDLGQTAVDDTGLNALRPLHRLRWLDLSETAITDAGLKVIDDLPELRTLVLSGTQVTDASIARLQTHPSLQAVYVQRTAVSPKMQRQLAAHFADRRPSP